MAATPFPTSAQGFVEATTAFVAALDTAEGRAASGLTEAQLAELSAASTAFESAQRDQNTAYAAYRATLPVTDAAADELERLYRAARKQANAAPGMTASLREAAGIGTPDPTHGSGELPVPERLEATRRPSGTVFLDWDGPTGGSLRYEVFARPDGDPATPWALVGSASSTDFTHRDAGPGPRRYRVEACRGERRGEPSRVVLVE